MGYVLFLNINVFEILCGNFQKDSELRELVT